jgi:subtilisin
MSGCIWIEYVEQKGGEYSHGENNSVMEDEMMRRRFVLYLVIFGTVLVFAVPAVSAGEGEVPSAWQGIRQGRVPGQVPVGAGENSPKRFYVHSDSPSLKAELKVRHQFRGVFSTELSDDQVGYLESEGIMVEPVQFYRFIKKPEKNAPVCGDGVCQGKERKTCPEDCSPGGEEPPSGSCSPATAVPWGVSLVNGGSGGNGVIVAVLDTGIKVDHPDLAGNIIDCKDMTTPEMTDGCIDEVGHGTHVAGTIAANGGPDGTGIYGVAPDARLMAIKVCLIDGCWGDDIANGIIYATDSGANIVSMSLGGQLPDYMMAIAIYYAVNSNVMVVAAAGNDGPVEGSIDYPAAFVEVVGVGAIRENWSVPSWSSRGINDGDYVITDWEIDFGAPGVSVESTSFDGCYEIHSGTSMAAPHVSGLAAKLWTGNAAETRSYLWYLSTDIDPFGDDPATGYGMPSSP